MGNNTATAVALRCAGKPPPQPDKRTTYTGQDDVLCRISAGKANAYGQAPRRQGVIAETFASPDDMAWEQSDAACAAYVPFITSSTLCGCVEGRLPEVRLWPQALWRPCSHLFADGIHRVMKPSDWYGFFMQPLEPPFMVVVSTTGKKNILHRAKMGQDSECFPAQLEEEAVRVRARLVGALKVTTDQMRMTSELVVPGTRLHTEMHMAHVNSLRAGWLLLADIPNVGGGWGGGFGRVSRWTVEEHAEDILRAIPADHAQAHGCIGFRAHAGIRQPGRRPEGQAACVVPGRDAGAPDLVQGWRRQAPGHDKFFT